MPFTAQQQEKLDKDFSLAAIRSGAEPGMDALFICPVCGGRAVARRSPDGKLSAHCEKCTQVLRQ